MSLTSWILAGGAFFLLLTWVAFFDLASRDFGSLGKKAAWAAALFVPFLGCAAYFALGIRMGKRKQAPAKKDLTTREGIG